VADALPRWANELIERELSDLIGTLGVLLDSDVVALYGTIVAPLDTMMRGVIEDLHARTGRRTLAVVLTTEGGFIEVVQRIVAVLRHHYERVAFVVPDRAFSAGTILVMSGDAIYMDYYARLGPIDPQVDIGKGQLMPALGYLIQWERLLQKARDGSLTPAEAELMISGFDQAELFKFEQARDLSIALLKDWLVRYKFRNWRPTDPGDGAASTERKEELAVRIATELNRPERWYTHGNGISMDVLRRDLGLEVDDFSANPTLAATIKGYHGLLVDYMEKRGDVGIIHAAGQYVRFLRSEPA
jgi:Serine dehydrogenase proteinase